MIILSEGYFTRTERTFKLKRLFYYFQANSSYNGALVCIIADDWELKVPENIKSQIKLGVK